MWFLDGLGFFLSIVFIVAAFKIWFRKPEPEKPSDEWTITIR